MEKIHGNLDVATSIVAFDNRLHAPYMDSVLKDDIVGTMVWSNEKPACHETVSQVFLGNATIHVKTNSTDLKDAIVLVNDQATNQYAGLLLQRTTSVCEHHGYGTQIPGVVVILLRTLDSPIPQASFRPQSPQEEIHAKTGMGFLHLHGHLRAAEKFATVWRQLCNIQRNTLHNKLQAIGGANNQYSLLDTHGTGSMVVVAGAVAYLAKCPVKDATIRPYPNCTTEIPVLVEGQPRFVDPISLVIRYYPQVLPCDDSLPVRWKIAGSWYCSSPPGQVKCQAPIQLKPGGKQTLDAKDFSEGLGQGIYSVQQRDMHHRLLVVMDSRAAAVVKMANDVTQGAHDGGRLRMPLSFQDYTDLRFHLGMDLVPMFRWFGTWWNVAFGILLTFGMLKVLAGMITRAYLLWVDKGCGWWMFAALWQTAFLWLTFPIAVIRTTTKQIMSDLEEGRPHMPGDGDPQNPPNPPDYAKLTQTVAMLVAELEAQSFLTARSRGVPRRRFGDVGTAEELIRMQPPRSGRPGPGGRRENHYALPRAAESSAPNWQLDGDESQYEGARPGSHVMDMGGVDALPQEDPPPRYPAGGAHRTFAGAAQLLSQMMPSRQPDLPEGQRVRSPTPSLPQPGGANGVAGDAARAYPNLTNVRPGPDEWPNR